MKPDHEAALAKCRAWPHKSNTAACYLDAMARLAKATELLRRAEAFAGSCMSWKRGAGELESDIAAFLDERKTQ